MLELYLYVVHEYFTAFYNRVHKLLVDKLHFDFYWAYSIDPQTSDATQQDVPHGISYCEGDLGNKDPHNKWYRPEIPYPTDQSRDSNPKPTNQVTWSYDTKPPASTGSITT